MQNEWFEQLNQVLKKSGQGVPVLLVDQTNLDANIQLVRQQLPSHLKPRLVVKSLTSLKLLSHIAKTLNCQRFMVFHAPHLPIVLESLQQPDQFNAIDILLGKPMPIAAVRQFYQHYPQFKDAAIQWLVDSLERLQQYLKLATEQQLQLQISIEIDIGLHRGGLQNPKQLQPLLELIGQHPQQLKLSGLMGYDAQVTKIPTFIQSMRQSYQQSQQRYQGFIEFIAQNFPDLFKQNLCFNGAGSPTFSLHASQSACNDIAFGSMLLKPTDFDIATLTQFKPALFIAVPVLKVLPFSQIPGLSLLDKVLTQAPVKFTKRPKALFVYGGNWLARYVYPNGIAINKLYGRSSNQEMVNVPKTCTIHIDDYVFLRPTQSEAVIGQFKYLYLFDGQQLVQWTTFND